MKGSLAGLGGFLAALLFFPLPGGLAASPPQDDPVVVSVGVVSYGLSQVQTYFDNVAQAYLDGGGTIAQGELAEWKQAVTDSFVGMGVMENKYRELFPDPPTPGEESALEASAQQIYQQYKESYAAAIAQEYGKTGEEALGYAETLMELDGVTMDTARQQALSQWKDERLAQAVAGELPPLSQEELEAYYQQNYVEPCREAYGNDIEAFETEVLYYGVSSSYLPEGYRYVRHILLKMPEELTRRLGENQEETEKAAAELELAQSRVSGLALLEEDTAQARSEAEAAQGRLDSLEKEYQEILDGAIQYYAGELAQIERRLEAGESFDALLAEYNQDGQMPREGFMVCQNSVLWAERFREGAMALRAPGDVSAPLATAAGVHILEYTADVPGGPVPLEGGRREEVARAGLQAKRYQVLAGFVEQWTEEYAVFSEPALLKTPECVTKAW